jgi:hypothetical protein
MLRWRDLGMGCVSSVYFWSVLVAVTGGCVALIGYAAVLTWRPGSTELVKSVIRHREDETEGESRKRWRGLILFLLPVFVLLAIINAIHLPKAAYVLWAATFIPIGAVDMGHWEHCKAVVRGRPEDPEIATMNRVARRTGPILIPLGLGVALLGIVSAVLTSICYRKGPARPSHSRAWRCPRTRPPWRSGQAGLRPVPRLRAVRLAALAPFAPMDLLVDRPDPSKT